MSQQAWDEPSCWAANEVPGMLLLLLQELCLENHSPNLSSPPLPSPIPPFNITLQSL